jgi:hypothetical protein
LIVTQRRTPAEDAHFSSALPKPRARERRRGIFRSESHASFFEAVAFVRDEL